MVRVEEKNVYSALLGYAGDGKPFRIGKAEVQVSLKPQDTHVGDSPDFILWLTVSARIFAQNLKIEIPLPIEAEGRGITHALEDFQKFVEREKFPIKLPMLVVASEGYGSVDRAAKLPAHFKIRQIPDRLLRY